MRKPGRPEPLALRVKGAASVLHFLIKACGKGERVALVTLTHVIGRSSRAPGTQMGVSESGAYLGSFSGGCIEAAVVAEARRVIESGVAETVRFGDGSPFIDIKLPCGGGIDLLITPQPPLHLLVEAHALLADRRPALLSLGKDGAISAVAARDGDSTRWRDEVFHVRHDPDLRIVIVGHGEETRALASIASAYGAQVVVLTPNSALVDLLRSAGTTVHHLKTPAPSPWLETDRFTATVFLFHDHDWESALLKQALEQDGFFVGAMGSRATHAVRIAALERAGVSIESIDRLTGPIGLIPATRDPETLALSALGQIAMRYEAACGRAASGYEPVSRFDGSTTPAGDGVHILQGVNVGEFIGSSSNMGG
ncbi:MAG: XdhC family protein [Sphingomonadales bacterium]|nr:XdhC family protein [Sphingomonadales bacterium]